MKKSFLLLLLFIVTISFTACKKGPIQYKFEGTVTQSLTGAALSGVDVKISQKIITNGITATGYKLAASEVTDANGQFSAAFDREMVTEFLFEYEKESYFPLEIIETSANITTDGANVLTPLLEPISTIQFQIKNSFPNDMDHFKLITQTFREGCQGCAENKTTDFYGELDTVITYLTTAGEYVKFTYINVAGASSTIDSLYTTPFETIVYPILY